MSTANCAPSQHGRSSKRTAPASRHTRHSFDRSGTLLHASAECACCSVAAAGVEDTVAPFSKSSCNGSKSNTRKNCGGIVYSLVVGTWAKAAPALQPECEQKCAQLAAAQYCHPCVHSPSSLLVFVGTRLPSRKAFQLGHQNPSLSNRRAPIYRSDKQPCAKSPWTSLIRVSRPCSPNHQKRLCVCHQMRLYVCHQMRPMSPTELASLAYLCSLRSHVFLTG